MENPVATNQHVKMATFYDDYDDGGGQGAMRYFDFPTQFVFYAIIAIFLMTIALVVKLLWDCQGEEGRNEERPSENSRLLSSKGEDLFSYYGTSGDLDDIESGTGTETGSCSTSSSEDLYDGKICVICYDEQRNCSFIPCGHCITCYSCAKRITSEENRSCPICRASIDKVRTTLIKIL